MSLYNVSFYLVRKLTMRRIVDEVLLFDICMGITQFVS